MLQAPHASQTVESLCYSGPLIWGQTNFSTARLALSRIDQQLHLRLTRQSHRIERIPKLFGLVVCRW